MKSRNFQRIWLAVLFIGPIVLLFLPAGYFDSGVALCPSRVFFNYECWGCGMTRAVMHLMHFDLDSAVFYNQGVVVVFPILVYIWWIWVKAAAKLSGFWPQKA